MKVENPFDWVKDIQKSTIKVDFVAVSPRLKEFKDEIEQILTPSEITIKMMHAIVGDVGTGKSHINHYIYDRAQERDDILVSYVSCKNLIQGVGEERGLFSLLLNALIMDMREKASEPIKSVIQEIHDNELGDEKITRAKKELKQAKDDTTKEYRQWTLEKAYAEQILKKDKFFKILKKIQESKVYEKNISRIIFIIDEFEIFDSPHHIKDLDNVWSLREDIMEFPNIIWIFSCLSGSWKSLSEEKKTVDLFGKNTTQAHMIPNYDEDDRREIIWSRMLSLIENYNPDKRKNYSTPEKMSQYCFPFYNNKVDGEFLDGYDLVNLLVKPELNPRRLISNCHDFYGDYSNLLIKKDDVVESYQLAKTELFKRHFFDLIDEGKFNNIANLIWNKIYDAFPGKAGRKEDFDVLLKQLYQIYLSRKIKGRGHYGFENDSVHMTYINALLQKTLKLKKAIDRPYYNAYQLVLDIERELRERCLEKIEDPGTDDVYLSFRIKDFQPEGAIPFLAELFHRELDTEASPNGFVTEEQMKDILTKILKRERGQPYDEYIYGTNVRELIEAQQIELDIKEHKGYFILNRSKRDIGLTFRDEISKIMRGKENPVAFFEILKDEDAGFFLPPLSQSPEGTYTTDIEIASKGSPGKLRKSKMGVLFWDKIPEDAIQQITMNKSSIIFTSCTEKEFEQSGLHLDNRMRGEMFTNYISKKDDATFLVLIPSLDYIDTMDYLTWRQFFFYLDRMEDKSKELGYESNISHLKKKLEYEINHLPEKLSKLPMLRWDEGDIYHLRFKSIGKTEIPIYTDLLSQIIDKDSVKVVDTNVKRLELLKEFYPWLSMDNRSISKEKSKCTRQIIGKDVDEGLFSLYNMVQQEQEPQNIDDIAEKYLQSIEEKYDITDRTKPIEKKSTLLTTKLLLNAMTRTFSEIFEIQDNEKISVIKEIDIEKWDDNIVSWFLSISDDKSSTVIIDIIYETTGILARQLIDDIKTTRKIYNEMPKSEKKKYLSAKEKSKVLESEIERFKFLNQVQSYAKQVIIELNKRCYNFLNTSQDKLKSAQTLIQETQKVLKDKHLNKTFQEKIKDILKETDLNKVIDNYEKLNKTKEKIDSLHKIINPKDPDIQKWIGLLKSKPDFVHIIYDLQKISKEIQDGLIHGIEKFESQIGELISEEQDYFSNFRVFLQDNMDIVTQLSDDTQRKNLYDIRNRIENLSHCKENQPLEALINISNAREALESGNCIFEELADTIISDKYSEHMKIIDNYLQLSLKYTEETEETKTKFKGLKDEMKKDMESFRKNARQSIVEQKDYERWVMEEPEKRGFTYRKKAQDLIKTSISKKHFEYQKQTMEDIKNNRLMKSLIEVAQNKGEKELLERLKFLYEMEKIGIISYQE